MSSISIDLQNVSVVYPTGTHALNRVNLRIRKGEFVFIVGPSGAGKSTIMKLLLREITPNQGKVMVNDYNLNDIRRRELPYFRRSLGVVFQDFRLIPSMTVYDNVAFALRVTGQPNRIVRKRVPYVLQLVKLAHKAKSYPPEISGGEQQRVALARALVSNPEMIILDEPTGNIDIDMAFEIVDLLDQINQHGITVVMVTHDEELVEGFPHRVVRLERGKIVADGVWNMGGWGR